MYSNKHSPSGFTLIELSITLIIIGLIVGGVLVGRDLIAASDIRSQISQIESLRTSTNTFKGKYGYFPGDIPSSEGSRFGFTVGSGAVAHGDGDDKIDDCTSSGSSAECNLGCETMLFWVHLSQAKLIPGNFNLASGITADDDYFSITLSPTVTVSKFLPSASIGQNNIAVYTSGFTSTKGRSFFLIANVQYFMAAYYASQVGLTPQQAYKIDTKIDDKLPGRGKVLSIGISTNGTTAYIPNTNTGTGGGVTGKYCMDAAGTSYNIDPSYINYTTSLACMLEFEVN